MSFKHVSYLYLNLTGFWHSQSFQIQRESARRYARICLLAVVVFFFVFLVFHTDSIFLLNLNLWLRFFFILLF